MERVSILSLAAIVRPYMVPKSCGSSLAMAKLLTTSSTQPLSSSHRTTTDDPSAYRSYRLHSWMSGWTLQRANTLPGEAKNPESSEASTSKLTLGRSNTERRRQNIRHADPTTELFDEKISTKRKDHGHRVRLATHSNFKEFVLSAGLEFFPLGGDPKVLAEYMVKNKGFLPSAPSEIPVQRKQIREIIFSLLAACKDPDVDSGIPFKADAIIANPPAYDLKKVSLIG